jgi:hypothetical protein
MGRKSNTQIGKSPKNKGLKKTPKKTPNKTPKKTPNKTPKRSPFNFRRKIQIVNPFRNRKNSTPTEHSKKKKSFFFRSTPKGFQV